MRRHTAGIAVAVTVVAVVAGVAWVGGTFGYRDEAPTFNLTGIGALGRWTLEPVNGFNYGWKDFEASTLYVHTADEVVIHLRSGDVFHRFYLPEFSVGPVDIEAGHTVTVRFKAARKGVFQFYCLSICGGCHFHMRGWLVVSDRGAKPIVPPPLERSCCLPRMPRPEAVATGANLVETGALLFEKNGCFTCHGLAGRGGVPNDNSLSRTVPPHNTTAQKFLLPAREDAEAFIRTVAESANLAEVEDSDVTAFPVVRARFLNAKEIVRKGRFTSPVDPKGPVPPLQMPAWQYLLDERQIDALLSYFVSLARWEDQGT